MKKKNVMVVLTIIMLSLTGCTSVGDSVTEEEQEEVQEPEVKEEKQEEEQTLKAEKADAEESSKDVAKGKETSEMAIGKVSEIEGNTITVVLGEMSMGGGKSPSGEKPSGEKTSGEKPSGEKPSGERPPEGEAPSQIPFTASDESITITFDGSVAIQMMTEGELVEGGTEDMAVDTMLSIAYDDTGAVTSVQIMGS